ncbi:MAG: hypothetical protein ACD_63C00092G0007 [uncultured bacterium]|nr:MAG: hypothetical protein ACD_63C00092G0007 [uncultured bacterium]
MVTDSVRAGRMAHGLQMDMDTAMSNDKFPITNFKI